MLKDSKKEKKNGSNGVPTPSGGTQPHIKSECPTPDPLAANAGITVPSVTVKDEPSTPNGGESMNNCENSGSNNCATLSGQSGNTSSGPQPTSGPDIKPNVCGPGGGINPMMGPNNVGSNPMDNFLNDPPMDKTHQINRNQKYICSVCNKTYISRTSLDSHLKSVYHMQKIRKNDDDKHSCKLLVVAPSTIKQNYLVNLFNLLPGLVRFDKTTDCSRLPTEEIYLAVYNTRSEATYVREKLDGYHFHDGERLIVKFDGDKK
ncbi:uncharacterized protein LOC136030883 isoform X1 [Artemia franciscana]|uniref:uncharacterized protein LOC136030883 isoform X1 n=1 Tax=Artemia franciscana TaxID=6661 RepID=UPI0032DB1B08